MIRHLFLNSGRQLRNGWWILCFLVVLALLLIPALINASEHSTEVSLGQQAVLVALASVICQFLRRKPLTELTGAFDVRWLGELVLGGLVGTGLMLVPALVLQSFHWVDWQWNTPDFATLTPNILLFAQVAIAEELLFRGFVFQRLIAGLGWLPAQLIVGFFFVLTHLNNPGMQGSVGVLAGLNIFVASLVFGFAFIRTSSLAMPLGLHFMANMMQGGILGLGVSGIAQAGLLTPVLHGAPEWLTGGTFGLEASLPGFLAVVTVLILLDSWKRTVKIGEA